MQKLKVLIVDDSTLMRNLIGSFIEDDEYLSLVGRAVDGFDALDKVEILKPDVITLDLEMPNLDGIGFLKELEKRSIVLPVIVLSSLATTGAAITMQALNLGAVDFITKPSGSTSLDIAKIAQQLITLIKVYGFHYLKMKADGVVEFLKREIDRPPLDPKRTQPSSLPPVKTPLPNNPSPVTPLEKELPVKEQPFNFNIDTLDGETPTMVWPRYENTKKTKIIEIVAIGVSTGGPNALRLVLQSLKKDFPLPLLIVQHMPEKFTAEFAKSLNQVCPLTVKEAEKDEPLRTGYVYIAPGNQHLTVQKNRSNSYSLKLNQDNPCNGHRPSVDILFESLAQNCNGRVLAVIMTGMGKDGVEQIGTLYSQGALTLAQDEASCVVYGMPRLAVQAGYIDQIVPLKQMATVITHLANEYHSLVL